MKFIGDTNSVPSGCALVRRMRFSTPKAETMFRPSDIQLLRTAPPEGEARPYIAADVMDRTNLGWTVKYVLRFDDGVAVEFGVSREADAARFGLDAGARVYVHVPAAAMMGFNAQDIDSTPLV
jgi:sulfate transport system ATP-binding protein